MIILYIISFIITTIALVLAFDKKFEEIIPVVFSGMILLFYILGFFKGLYLAKFFIIFIMVFSLVYILIKYNISKKKGENLKLKNVFTFGTLVMFIFVIIVTFLMKDREIVNFDELNHWGVEVKSLWYSNGYMFGNRNCSLAYGDYPPAVQLFQWWGMNVVGKFNEGVYYISYFILNISFVIPLLKNTKLKWFFAPIVVIILLIFPSMICPEAYIYGVDATLGFIFGYVIFSIMDDVKKDAFYFLKIILPLAVLGLVKSTGIIWVIASLIFYLSFHLIFKRKSLNRFIVLKSFFVVIVPIVFYASWQCWVKISGNATYLTNIAKENFSSILGGDWSFPENTKDFLYDYINTFVFKSLNGVHWTPSALLWLIIFVVLIFVSYKIKLISKKRAKIVIVFFIIVSSLYFTILFFTGITMFAGESVGWISDFEIIRKILSRYGAPVFIGGLLIVSYIFLDNLYLASRKVKIGVLLSIIISCAVFTNYYCVKNYIIFANEIESNSTTNYKKWSDLISDKEENRVMYWSNTDSPNRYELVPLSSYQFAPDFENINITEELTLRTIIDKYDYTYIYYATETEKFLETAQSMMENQDEKFEVGGLYKINKDSEYYTLSKVN